MAVLPVQSRLKTLLIHSLGLEPEACRGKVIVVTGAGRGIGLDAARAFAALGGSVILAEISPENGRKAEEAIRKEGGQALFIQTDVSKSQDVHRLAERTLQAYGQPEILINNAMRCPVAAVVEMEESLWQEVITVNLTGTFLTCKAFLPGMLVQQRGVIINMISTDAMPGLSAYIGSKQGITGFSQSLAVEIATSGVKVVPFAPGMVDTPGIRSAAEGLAPRLGMSVDQFLSFSLHPAYEGYMPSEHAAAATAFLALRLANEFHGETINGYEVLERAGFLKPDQIQVSATTIKPQTAAGVQASSLSQHLENNDEVARILVETEVEFSKLPLFARPLARGGFKSKSGLSLNDWHRALTAYRQKIESSSSGSPIPESETQRLHSLLEKLINYYRGVPGETARFTRDRQMLQEVNRVCELRIAAIQKLVEQFN
jgi:NAD(P)-dependent dehydrogenase (short-subunit alcohol dehydrogenase family)